MLFIPELKSSVKKCGKIPQTPTKSHPLARPRVPSVYELTGVGHGETAARVHHVHLWHQLGDVLVLCQGETKHLVLMGVTGEKASCWQTHRDTQRVFFSVPKHKGQESPRERNDRSPTSPKTPVCFTVRADAVWFNMKSDTRVKSLLSCS